MTEEDQKHKKRVLFVCKERNHDYGPSFGLINSCRFVANALIKHGIDARVVMIVDNNGIDKEVHDYQPTHVFVEALWVVPSKFPILIALHPEIEWFVRVHSKIPFIAHEGMAVKWLREYGDVAERYPSFHITANNFDIVDSLGAAYGINVMYFPNIYEPNKEPQKKEKKPDEGFIDIGCFGAIRPMKNQLYQALAAIIFGNELDVKVRFHINGDRIENKGEPILHNLQAAFKDTDHELVIHPWLHHNVFIDLVRTMDLGMQVSMSETFDIVAADFVWNDIPLVGSDEIEWLDKLYKADPNDLNSILKKLYTAYEGGIVNLQKVNLKHLERYNKESLEIWLESL